MGNLPITAHITVVHTAPSGGSDPGAGVASAVANGEGADFSNLLAGQLGARIQALANQKPDAKQTDATSGETLVSDAAVTSGALNPQDALPVEASSDAAAQVIAFIPAQFNAAPLAHASQEADEHGLRLALGKDEADEHGLHLALGKDEAGGLGLRKPDVEGAAVATGKPDLPANLAAQSPSLPARELAQGRQQEWAAFDPALKPNLRSEDVALPANERPTAVLAHGIVGTKADTSVAVPQTTPALSVESRVGAAEWGKELGQKVAWLATQQQQVAHINVTPPHLGPIEIRLNLASDHATAVFVSPHAAVREAIEAALPRLREMLADSGLNLGNVDVSAHSFGHARQEQAQHEGQSRGPATPSIAAMGDAGPLLSRTAAIVRKGNGLVDIFA